LESSNATGVNGTQTDNSAGGAGSAYVFVRSGVTWSQQAYLKASNTELADTFGSAVAISGNTIVVGAQYEASNATGVNGNQTDNSASGAGAAYVFTSSGATWSQQAYLKASNTGAGDAFGLSVAISGDTIVVGANGEDSNATGVGGNPNDNSATNAGAAYTYALTTNWVVYLPLVSTAPPQPAFVVLRDTPFPARTAQQGEVFWQGTLSTPTATSGTYVLAASADGTLPALVDDEIRLLVNGQVLFSYDFSASGHLVAAIVPLPAAVLTQIQGQTVTIELADRYGGKVEATPLYLVQRP
jgi:hypothetical protein